MPDFLAFPHKNCVRHPCLFVVFLSHSFWVQSKRFKLTWQPDLLCHVIVKMCTFLIKINIATLGTWLFWWENKNNYYLCHLANQYKSENHKQPIRIYGHSVITLQDKLTGSHFELGKEITSKKRTGKILQLLRLNKLNLKYFPWWLVFPILS